MWTVVEEASVYECVASGSAGSETVAWGAAY